MLYIIILIYFCIRIGSMQGQGVLCTRAGKYFQGEFLAGLPHGLCELRDYSWDWEKSDGLGAPEETEVQSSFDRTGKAGDTVRPMHKGVGALRYLGEWQRGRPHGENGLFRSDGDEYRGGFREVGLSTSKKYYSKA
jgi:hypothetical protein